MTTSKGLIMENGNTFLETLLICNTLGTYFFALVGFVICAALSDAIAIERNGDFWLLYSYHLKMQNKELSKTNLSEGEEK
jgi:hypothetical protein